VQLLELRNKPTTNKPQQKAKKKKPKEKNKWCTPVADGKELNKL